MSPLCEWLQNRYHHYRMGQNLAPSAVTKFHVVFWMFSKDIIWYDIGYIPGLVLLTDNQNCIFSPSFKKIKGQPKFETYKLHYKKLHGWVHKVSTERTGKRRRSFLRLGFCLFYEHLLLTWLTSHSVPFFVDLITLAVSLSKHTQQSPGWVSGPH